jgi:hypothetical protein
MAFLLCGLCSGNVDGQVGIRVPTGRKKSGRVEWDIGRGFCILITFYWILLLIKKKKT